MNYKTRKSIQMKRNELKKNADKESKRREEYYECMRQEQIKKEEEIKKIVTKVDRVFKFLDLGNPEVLKTISERVSSIHLKSILDCWLNGNLLEDKKGKDFLEAISENFTSFDLFKCFEKSTQCDKEDFQESFVDYLEKEGFQTFKANSLEKVIAFEIFKEEWKNK